MGCRSVLSLSPTASSLGIDFVSSHHSLLARLPRRVQGSEYGAMEKTHEYKFRHVFPASASTRELYGSFCRPAVQRTLDGYNSCIFAYGQTGSGKTFTITGAPFFVCDFWLPRRGPFLRRRLALRNGFPD